jgi:IS30 family transposase
LIAKTINCHRATVYRELKRCNGQLGYCPDHAQTNACDMRHHSAKYTIPDTRVSTVRFLLKHDWGPEQISQMWSGMDQAVSHEWIYRFVARNKHQGGKLYRHLRQGYKRYRRGKKEKAPVIKNGIPIESVDTRDRFGDWGNRYRIRQAWHRFNSDDTGAENPFLLDKESGLNIC